MQVSEIMHRGIRSVNINDSVRKVAELMREEDIGAVPVLEKDKPVGFVTDRDIVISCVAEGYSLDESISHAMNEDVYCVTEDQDLSEATKLMKDNQVSRVLVVDKSEKPIGMVSLQDLTQATSEKQSGDTLEKIKH
jgi:CBS domain-containing protein